MFSANSANVLANQAKHSRCSVKPTAQNTYFVPLSGYKKTVAETRMDITKNKSSNHLQWFWAGSDDTNVNKPIRYNSIRGTSM